MLMQEGTWNKVGMMRQILEDTPPERAEWIVHMQPETFFDDTTFAIPFDSYRDKDLILIGNQTALRNGQMRGESVPQNYKSDSPSSALGSERQSLSVMHEGAHIASHGPHSVVSTSI